MNHNSTVYIAIIMSSSFSHTSRITMNASATQASHGYLAQCRPHWQPPRCTVFCDQAARPGYSDIPAHEFLDDDAVLREKVDLLAQLLLLNSNGCMCYTGAGISTSAGISDYASRTAGEASNVHQVLQTTTKKKSSLQARPTFAHNFLVKLQEGGVLQWWCQQNHDGLPQKAGFPQHLLNEIHGAWFDPSNRVVQFDEDLRDDLYAELLQWEKKARLCLAVGTSLSGMNADRLVESCGERSKQQFMKWYKNHHGGEVLEVIPECVLQLGGSVILGFQRTRLDDCAALRIYASIDTVFHMLQASLLCILETQRATRAEESFSRLYEVLQRPVVDNPQLWIERVQLGAVQHRFFGRSRVLEEHVYEIFGYDGRTGQRVPCSAPTRSSKTSMKAQPLDMRVVLDLRAGKRLQIAIGNDKGCTGEVQRITTTGNYEILWKAKLRVKDKNGKKVVQEGHIVRVLGLWMVMSALEGQLAILPVLNA